LPFASVLKQVLLQSCSYENDLDLHDNELIEETYFHKNGFAQLLILTQWQRATWKWLIARENDIFSCLWIVFN